MPAKAILRLPLLRLLSSLLRYHGTAVFRSSQAAKRPCVLRISRAHTRLVAGVSPWRPHGPWPAPGRRQRLSRPRPGLCALAGREFSPAGAAARRLAARRRRCAGGLLGGGFEASFNFRACACVGRHGIGSGSVGVSGRLARCGAGELAPRAVRRGRPQPCPRLAHRRLRASGDAANAAWRGRRGKTLFAGSAGNSSALAAAASPSASRALGAAHEHMRQVRPFADRLSPCGRRPHRAFQLAVRPLHRRPLPAAHRRHRHRTQPGRARRCHLGTAGLARNRSRRGACVSVGQPRPASRSRREAAARGQGVSLRCREQRSRGHRAGRRLGCALSGGELRAGNCRYSGCGARRSELCGSRDGRLRALAFKRHPYFFAGQRHRRHRHGHHPRHSRRRPAAEHPQSHDGDERSRSRRPRLCASAAAGERAAQEALQAPRRCVAGDLARTRLSARSHGELSGDLGLGPARRHRDPPDG